MNAPPNSAPETDSAALPRRSLKRPLLVSAVLMAGVAACAWLIDEWLLAMMLAMVCFWALLWQMARLFYYLVRWNKFGLKLVGVRLVMWTGALFATIAAHNVFVSATQERADKLVGAIKAYHAREGQYPGTLEALAPRDIPQVPRLARGGGSQKFHYRTAESGYTLGYPSGWMTMTNYDSRTGKWETRD